MPSLPTTLAVLCAVSLWSACPAHPAEDAGSGDSDVVDAGSTFVDAGGLPDGGDLDAGAQDDAADAELDAGADAGGDAGFVCEMPSLDPPPPLDEDAGPPDCVLDDIEGSTGHFEGTWEGQVFGSFPLSGPFDLPARGEMAFDIYCGDDKLLVDGVLEGRAYQHADAGPDEPGHPFSGRLYGEYSLATGLVTMFVNPATLTVGPFNGTFRVAMSGQRASDAFEDGSWCGVTISPPGGAGDGTWRADLIR